MTTNGIRILDGEDNVLRVKLSDILEEISNENSICWSLLFLDGTPAPGHGKFLSEYENRINNSEHGLRTSWEDLKAITPKFFQMFEITILGCKNANLLRRYSTEEEMYKTCDIVIELIDCAFWEVHSKDQALIERLRQKFNEVKLLN
jgi:hypothetical protein